MRLFGLFCSVLGWRPGAFVGFVLSVLDLRAGEFVGFVLCILGRRAGAFVEVVLLFLGGGAYARPPRGLPWATHPVTRTHTAHYEGRCVCMNHWMQLTVHRIHKSMLISQQQL